MSLLATHELVFRFRWFRYGIHLALSNGTEAILPPQFFFFLSFFELRYHIEMMVQVDQSDNTDDRCDNKSDYAVVLPPVLRI